MTRNYRPYYISSNGTTVQIPLKELKAHYAPGQSCKEEPYPKLPFTLKNGDVVDHFVGCGMSTLIKGNVVCSLESYVRHAKTGFKIEILNSLFFSVKGVELKYCKSAPLNGYCETETQLYHFLWNHCDSTEVQHWVSNHDKYGLCEGRVPARFLCKH